MRISFDQLKEIAPNCRYPDDWVRPLNDAMAKAGISNTIQRAAAFLGQVAHESAEFNRVEENLNYSPQRVMTVWPTRFANLEAALHYARNPERLGNRVYADRMGNGPEHTGDGYRYRGRGLIQITGRDNYVRIAEMMNLPGLVDMPDWLLTPRLAALSAAMYWQDNNLNEIADTITGKNLKARVKVLTRRVNGGLNGLEQRLEFTQRALLVLDTGFEM